MRRSDDLRRRRPSREPYPRILIVCEGEVTEKRYFERLRHEERIQITLEVVGGMEPKTTVECARARKNDGFDEIWCVFDVDRHPYIREATEQAKANKFGIAISNPCFELWVLLHFDDHTAYIDRGKLQSKCREHLPGYKKDLPCEKLFPRYPEAHKRAADLEAWQERRSTPGANPSTTVHRLVAHIKSFRAPQ